MRASGSRRRPPFWGDLLLLAPVLLAAPLALLPLQYLLRCMADAALQCHAVDSRLALAWHYAGGLVFWGLALAGVVAVLATACMGDAYLQRHRGQARLLLPALAGGIAVVPWLLLRMWPLDGAGKIVWLAALALLPLIVALRHLPRLTHAALARNDSAKVAHVQ